MAKKLQYLVIHCTASQEGREVTGADIRRMHTSPPPVGHGWGQVGYTDLIHLNGGLENLVKHDEDQWVDPREITNGVLGYNAISRHICYVGGVDAHIKPKDTRTLEQKKTLETEVKKTIKLHPDIKVLGHCQLDPNKACPSFNVPDWLRQIGVAEKNIY